MKKIEEHLLTLNYSSLKLAAASSILWTIATYLLIGFYYEDFDGYIANQVAGVLNNKPMSDLYVYGLTFTARLYAFLHSFFPAVPWMGVIGCFQLVISACILQAFLLESIRQRYAIRAWQAMIICAICFLCLFSGSFVNFGFTRVSFIASGSGLIGLLWVTEKTGGIKKWLTKTALFIFFTLGFLIRFEAGLGACLLVGVFALFNGTTLKNVITVFLPVCVFVAATLLFLHEKADEVPFLKAVEPNLYYIADATYQPNYFEGKSQKDSIKYEAIRSNLLNDEQELTAALVQSFAKEKMQNETLQPSPVLRGLKVAFSIAAPCVKRNFDILLFSLLLLIIFIAAWHQGQMSVWFKWSFLIYQLFFWALVLALAYLVKMEDRIFVPMAILHSACTLLLLTKADLNSVLENNKYRVLFFLTAVLLCSTVPVKIIMDGNAGRRELQTKDNAINEVNKMAKDKILMIDVDSRIIVHGTPFRLAKFQTPKRILEYDSGQFAMLPSYKEYLNRECNCNSSQMNEFYKFLYLRRNEVLFVSTDQRLKLIKDYLRIVHHADYKFEKLKGSYIISKNNSWGVPLYYYTLD